MAYMKRKRVYAPRRTMKKRRITVRRRFTRRTKTTQTGTRGQRVSSDIRQQRPRANIKRWRSILWNMSTPLTHYRSAATRSNSFSGATGGNHDLFNFNALSVSNVPFWTVAGGVLPVSFGTAAADVVADYYVLRGGMISIHTIAAPSNEDDLEVRIQLIYPKQQWRNFQNANNVSPRQEWYDVISATYPKNVGQTLQDEPDYDTYYHRPILDKVMLLKPGDGNKMQHKLKVNKIDADEFRRGMGPAQPEWMVYVGGLTATASSGIEIICSHNISFAKM